MCEKVNVACSVKDYEWSGTKENFYVLLFFFLLPSFACFHCSNSVTLSFVIVLFHSAYLFKLAV